MIIDLKFNAVAGKISIPRGKYLVALNPSTGEINLAGGGADIKVQATRRKNKTHFKTTSVQFYCGGGSTWSLLICMPKFGEYIAMIEAIL